MKEGEFRDLSLLDEGQLAEMFQRRGNDPTFLDALNEELKQRNSEAANDLALGHGAHPSRVGDVEHHQHPMTAQAGRLFC